jgi:hypothetical protein
MKASERSTLWKFNLGEQVKDTVTGFKGIITARIEYINGCLQYCVEPKVDKEGKPQKHQYVDEGQLELVPSKKRKPVKKDPPGGVMSNCLD